MKIKKFSRTLGVGAAAGALVIAGAAAAFAASSYNLDAGSASSGTTFEWTATTTGASPQVHFEDANTGAAFTCASAAAHGTATTGSNLGNPLGEIQDTSAGSGTVWNGCEDSATSSPLTVTGTYPWHLNGNGDTVAGVTPGTITNIHAHVHANNGLCDFDVTGQVDVKWTNDSPSTLEVLANPTLTIEHVSGFGCTILGVGEGDPGQFSATYSVTADNPAYNPVTLTSNP